MCLKWYKICRFTVLVTILIFPCVVNASDKMEDQTLLWEAGRLVQPDGFRAMLQTNDVVRKVYRELDLQQQLVAEAVRRGISERIAVRQDIETARRSVLIAALATDIRAEAPKPEDAEARAAYEANPTVFTLPERYLLDVIQLDPDNTNTMAAGRALHDSPDVGDDAFFAVVGQVIVTQRAGGWVTRPHVAPEIWQKLPLMQEGKVMFFAIDTGAFLVRRGPYNAPAQMTYEQAYDLIYQQLLLRSQDAHWKAFLENYTR